MQGGSGIWVKFNFVSPKSPEITNVSPSLLAKSLMGQGKSSQVLRKASSKAEGPLLL